MARSFSYLLNAILLSACFLGSSPSAAGHPTNIPRPNSLSDVIANPGSLSGKNPTPGDGLVNLALAAKINVAGVSDIAAADRARASMLRNLVSRPSHSTLVREQARAESGSIDAYNNAVAYTVTIHVGEPAEDYTLIVDTGSSNTWVGANKEYTPSQTSKSTGKEMGIKYGSAEFSGKEYIDKVDIGSGLIVESQTIGVADKGKTKGFDGVVDGILGIGPTDLTKGTVSGSSDTIPTIPDNLYSQGTINVNAVSLFFAPHGENVNGTLTFGGPNPSLYTGEIHYVPKTTVEPANQYWGIDQSITYGDKEILPLRAGIVDSGTSLILLATDAFNAYRDATGSTFDKNTGLLRLPSSQYSELKPLNFNIGGQTFSLSPNGQIWPRSLNKDLGGEDGYIYLIVADMGESSGKGFDFINGYGFTERYYTIHDTTDSRIGFAHTQYTDSTSN